MESTADFIKHSKTINEGTTCYIMMHESNVTYKLYKRAVDYILKNSEYELEENDTLNRLNYIVSKKRDVKMTDIPDDILTFKGKAVGVPLTYYSNGISLKDYLMDNKDNVDVDLIKQKIIDIVNELINNGIIPTDPHLDNFLIIYKDDGSYEIKMIDVDDQYISIYPDNKRDVWYDSEVAACYRVIDLSFEQIYNSSRIK